MVRKGPASGADKAERGLLFGLSEVSEITGEIASATGK